LRVFAEPESGFAPHTATIRIDNPSGLTIAGVAYENLGSAVLDTSGANQEVLGKLTLASGHRYADCRRHGCRWQRVPAAGWRAAESKSGVDTLLKAVWNTYTGTSRRDASISRWRRCRR